MIGLLERDEGLGTVYERHRLWQMLTHLQERFQVVSALEAPVRGVSGILGINGIPLLHRRVRLCLTDSHPSALSEAGRALKSVVAGQPLLVQARIPLPFRDETFDLVYCLNGLSHCRHPEALLVELVRVCRKALLLVLGNEHQMGHFWAKYGWNRSFFKRKQSSFGTSTTVRKLLRSLPVQRTESGYIDCPPWPDSGLPIHQILRTRTQRPHVFWHWNSLAGLDAGGRNQRRWMKRLSFLEETVIFRPFRAIWAHHKYLIYEKRTI